MEILTIKLTLNDNRTQSKIVSVTSETSYKDILKIATNKFRQKILTVFKENDQNKEIYDLSNAQNGDTFYCSTKILEVKDSKNESKNEVLIKVIAINSYIQDNAINQLESMRSLKGATHIFGMPDLHVGGGVPIGSVTITDGIIHPALIGDDIGCGMSLFKVDIKSNMSTKQIKSMSNLLNLENGEDVVGTFDKSSLDKYKKKLPLDFLTKSIGTIGRGNHFAELQIVEKIYNQELANQYSIDQNWMYLTVHSGSRGFGDAILNAHHNEVIGIEEYKELHQIALSWATYNRDTIARRFCYQIGSNQMEKIAEIFHNFYEECDGQIIHRKGSAPCEMGNLIVIPGSRGALTYVVCPLKSDISHGYSVSHGAGRKVSRAKAVDIMNNSDDKDKNIKLNSNEFGDNVVICENKDLFCEEAPFAYKDIHTVIEDLVELGLVEIVMSLRPVITYKYRDQQCNC